MKKFLNSLIHNLMLLLICLDTIHNKSYLFEYDISKIKINYLGWALWAQKYDYIIADNNIITENNKNNYSENVLYMQKFINLLHQRLLI